MIIMKLESPTWSWVVTDSINEGLRSVCSIGVKELLPIDCLFCHSLRNRCIIGTIFNNTAIQNGG